MHDGRLGFECQPIRAVRDRAVELYRECTVRTSCGHFPGVLSRASFMPSLERIGRACEFDGWVVQRLLDRLKIEPQLELGYRIGTQSATLDAEWVSIFEGLATHADVASRLVIEVDGACVPPPSA